LRSYPKVADRPGALQHEKGALTGAQHRRLARFDSEDGGPIFLDEIGELPAEEQISLLRVLQEREFERVGGNRLIRTDVTVITATNRNLQGAIAEGTFRSDLFYWLNAFPIEIPPLSERKGGHPMLVEFFLDRFAKKAGTKIREIEKATMDRLLSCSWPGTLANWQNVIDGRKGSRRRLTTFQPATISGKWIRAELLYNPCPLIFTFFLAGSRLMIYPLVQSRSIYFNSLSVFLVVFGLINNVSRTLSVRWRAVTGELLLIPCVWRMLDDHAHLFFGTEELGLIEKWTNDIMNKHKVLRVLTWVSMMRLTALSCNFAETQHRQCHVKGID
jgi:Sigma-54 interaction domain